MCIRDRYCCAGGHTGYAFFDSIQVMSLLCNDLKSFSNYNSKSERETFGSVMFEKNVKQLSKNDGNVILKVI